MEPQEPYEYEVDLRDYIDVIWKNKWLILIIFVIAVGAAYGFSKTEPERYETETTLLVTPRISEQLMGKSEGSLPDTGLSAATYEKLATANDLLQKIADRVNSETKGESRLGIGSLQGKMNVSIKMEKTSGEKVAPLITMTVNGIDSERIKSIANIWASEFVKKNTELLSSETARSYEFISTRLQEVENELESRETARLEYLEEHPLELLENQLTVQKNSYRKIVPQLKDNKIHLVGVKERLAATKVALEEEPQYWELEKSVSKEALWNFLLQNKGADESIEESKLEQLPELKTVDQALNSIYVNLKSKLHSYRSEVNSLEKEIERLEERELGLADQINETEILLEKRRMRLSQFSREISRLESSYNTLSSNLEEARIAKEEKESSIRIMEEAIAPQSPTASPTKTNMAVAGVLGLFIGVLVAFFKNYMEGYEPEEHESEGDEGE